MFRFYSCFSHFILIRLVFVRSTNCKPCCSTCSERRKRLFFQDPETCQCSCKHTEAGCKLKQLELNERTCRSVFACWLAFIFKTLWTTQLNIILEYTSSVEGAMLRTERSNVNEDTPKMLLSEWLVNAASGHSQNSCMLNFQRLNHINYMCKYILWLVFFFSFWLATWTRQFYQYTPNEQSPCSQSLGHCIKHINKKNKHFIYSLESLPDNM